MSPNRIKSVVEAVGVIAVVSSLIFVGLQIKQTSDIAISQQYNERLAVSTDFWNAQLEHDIIMDRFGSRIVGNRTSIPGLDQSISAGDVGRLWIYYARQLFIYDNLHLQYELGFLAESSWDAYRPLLGSLLRDPFAQFVYNNSSWRQTFSELCDTLISQAN